MLSYLQHTDATRPSPHNLEHAPTQTLSSGQHDMVASEEARPRLVMCKLVLRNFKSYAGVVEVGPFHKSFTSVVGPNGSGKSNVIDALLFVFGFKAKKMRQGKLSELIHNSTNHQDLRSCSVEVHFQEIVDLPGPDAYEIVSGSQLLISRTVEKGTSEKSPDKSSYRINGKLSNFTEVTNLLKQKGVDLEHKRFLILQGEVESISLMKPKAQNDHEDGLLEYLEDIIGTTHFKEPIEEANKLLDELNEERSEKLNRLTFVEKDRASLEAKRQEALTFIRTENELVSRKNKLYHIYVYETSQALATAEEIISELKGQLELETSAHQTLHQEVSLMNQSLNEIQNDYNAIASKAEMVKEELQRYERAEVEFKEKNSHLLKKRKKLETTLHKEGLEQSSNETWIRNFEGDLAKSNREIALLGESLLQEEANLATITESLRGKTDGLQRQVEKLQVQLAPWTEKRNAAEAELEVLRSERELLQNQANTDEKLLTEASDRVLELKQKISHTQQEARELVNSKQATEKQALELKSEITALRQTEANAKGIFTEVATKVDEARASLQAAQTRGKVHTSLLQQSHAGRISGICGRLGDLGVVDDKYDVAVTTACSALDAIVVDSVESAQTCIEHLRKQSLGRATFICLDKLKKWDMKPINTPENVPRLFDLIKPKVPKYAIAFYQSLQDTLVADDLPQANRIAFGSDKRYRVVTLDGQLIDTSGTMSGGGNKAQKGGMSSKFRSDITTEALTVLENDKQTSAKNLDETRKRAQMLEEKLEALTNQAQPRSNALEKVKIELSSLQSALIDAEKHLAELRQQHRGPSAEEIKRHSELGDQIETAGIRLADWQRQAEVIEQEINKLQEKILEVGGLGLRSQKAKVDSIREQIVDAKTKVTKLQVEKSTKEKNLKKLVKSMAKLEAGCEEISQELEQLSSSLESQRLRAVELKARVQEADEVLEEKQEELLVIRETLDKKAEEMGQVRKAKAKTEAQLEEQVEARSTNQKQYRFYLQEIESNLVLQPTGNASEDTNMHLPRYDASDIAAFSRQSIERDIEKLQDKINEGTPNLEVLQEYKEKHEAYLARAADLAHVTQQRDQAKTNYEDLRNRRLTEFMTGFTNISVKLKEMYQMITLGGNAELELVDSLDPFSEGIIFSVMPPKKSWKNISNLSGGEKTLSSLALVFALHHFKPTPLYVMDEIDAALDFRNVSIVANYIKERTKNAQFVIISLRNNMFELADRLVGIYKTDNTTKSITIDPAAVAG
ncbi:RecF/RecN/SMC [Phlyctochytrium arcticum]|nr:RecF/RecN/SMC [Phlyctochytrium arcticum]